MPGTPKKLDDFIRELFTLLPLESPSDFAAIVDILDWLPTPEQRCNAVILGKYFNGNYEALKPIVNVNNINEVHTWLENFCSPGGGERYEKAANQHGFDRFLYTYNLILNQHGKNISKKYRIFLRNSLATAFQISTQIPNYGFDQAQFAICLENHHYREYSNLDRNEHHVCCENHFFNLQYENALSHHSPEEEEKKQKLLFDETSEALYRSINYRLHVKHDIDKVNSHRMSIMLVHFFTALDLIAFAYGTRSLEIDTYFEQIGQSVRGVCPEWDDFEDARDDVKKTYLRHLDDLRSYIGNNDGDGKDESLEQNQLAFIQNLSSQRQNSLQQYLDYFKASTHIKQQAKDLNTAHRDQLLSIITISFFFALRGYDELLRTLIQDQRLKELTLEQPYFLFFYLFKNFYRHVPVIEKPDPWEKAAASFGGIITHQGPESFIYIKKLINLLATEEILFTEKDFKTFNTRILLNLCELTYSPRDHYHVAYYLQQAGLLQSKAKALENLKKAEDFSDQHEIFNAVRTLSTYKLLTQKTFDAVTNMPSKGVALADSLNLLKQHNLLVPFLETLIQYRLFARHICLALSSLDKVDLLSQDNVASIFQNIRYVCRLAVAFHACAESELLTQERFEMLIKHAEHASTLSLGIIRLDKKMLLTDSFEAIFQQHPHQAHQLSQAIIIFDEADMEDDKLQTTIEEISSNEEQRQTAKSIAKQWANKNTEQGKKQLLPLSSTKITSHSGTYDAIDTHHSTSNVNNIKPLNIALASSAASTVGFFAAAAAIGAASAFFYPLLILAIISLIIVLCVGGFYSSKSKNLLCRDKKSDEENGLVENAHPAPHAHVEQMQIDMADEHNSGPENETDLSISAEYKQDKGGKEAADTEIGLEESVEVASLPDDSTYQFLQSVMIPNDIERPKNVLCQNLRLNKKLHQTVIPILQHHQVTQLYDKQEQTQLQASLFEAYYKGKGKQAAVVTEESYLDDISSSFFNIIGQNQTHFTSPIPTETCSKQGIADLTEAVFQDFELKQMQSLTSL